MNSKSPEGIRSFQCPHCNYCISERQSLGKDESCTCPECGEVVTHSVIQEVRRRKSALAALRFPISVVLVLWIIGTLVVYQNAAIGKFGTPYDPKFFVVVFQIISFIPAVVAAVLAGASVWRFRKMLAIFLAIIVLVSSYIPGVFLTVAMGYWLFK